jgi:hypothetical protein
MRAMFWLLAAAALTAAAWAYLPGLRGGFLFDDSYNLESLGSYGSVHHLQSLLLYLTSGEADALGRPLSLLSFLIDATNWPADPEPFKRTNIALHLINGGLLIGVLLKLGLGYGLSTARARFAALFGGSLWLLHPLWVSTTLYVIQREAMLPASWALLAMLVWMEGRSRLLDGGRYPFLYLTLAAGLCTLLAALCKANGVLIPLLLLTLETTILPAPTPQQVNEHRQLKRVTAVMLGIPSLCLLAAALWQIAGFRSEPYSFRAWNGYQHLITEPRVLLDYLHLLLVPQASISGLFNDGYPISTGLLHPASTLAAVIGTLALLAAGLLLRRRMPLFAFPVLFFFAAHLLESTVWPLELYFEHRSYIAALPLFWPFAVLLSSPQISVWLRYGIVVILLPLLTMLTHERASIWGDPQQQALLMMADPHQDSPRAAITAANTLMQSGQSPLAAHWLREALRHHPDDLPLSLTLITADCLSDHVSTEDLATAHSALRHDRLHLDAAYVWFPTARDIAAAGHCAGLDWAELDRLFAAARDNPAFGTQARYGRTWWNQRGVTALARQQPEEALDDFNQALLQQRNYDQLLAQMALLGSAGHPELALAHRRYFDTLTQEPEVPVGMPRIHAWLLGHTGYWSAGLEQLTATLSIDAAKRGLPSTNKVP